MPTFQSLLIENGIWVRPFGKLVYIMPPYVITDDELITLCQALLKVVRLCQILCRKEGQIMSVLFISGIDTDIGKTYATGMLAKALMQQGVNVITQKLVQTGVAINPDTGTMGIADDIMTHRKLMEIPLQPCDVDFTTCPYRYEKPASPHLSADLPTTFSILT